MSFSTDSQTGKANPRASVANPDQEERIAPEAVAGETSGVEDDDVYTRQMLQLFDTHAKLIEEKFSRFEAEFSREILRAFLIGCAWTTVLILAVFWGLL